MQDSHVDRLFTITYLPACLALLIVTVTLTHPTHPASSHKLSAYDLSAAPSSESEPLWPGARESASQGGCRITGWRGGWRLCSIRRCCQQTLVAGLPSPRVRICGAFCGFAAAMVAVPLVSALTCLPYPIQSIPSPRQYRRPHHSA